MAHDGEAAPAVCLAGPTGSGKTNLAVRLAAIWNCEIINADSRQLYRDFPIITAQPTVAEQCGVTHHLYGILPSREKLCAAEWARMAAEKAWDILGRGKIPLLVGGTGFYLAALLEGLAEMPPIPEEARRQVAEDMERLGAEALYGRLKRLDPEWAAAIHPHDRQRIMRGLEVFEGSGRPLSWWHKQKPSRPLGSGPCFFLDVSLQGMENGLRSRIMRMLAMGAADEARAAHELCPDTSAPGWSGIGCREALWHAMGRLDKAECVERWYRATRSYAKRQLTWFRGKKYCRARDAELLLRFAETHSPFEASPENFAAFVKT